MRSKIWRVIFFGLICALITPTAQAAEIAQKIQIDVVAISTQFGTPAVSEAQSREIVNKITSGMNDATGGLIQFSLRAVLPVIAANFPIQASTDVEKVSGVVPRPDAGFDRAILIGVITNNPTLPFAGMDGGDFMLLNGTWNLPDTEVVTHELGHNLGLLHANSAVCTTQLPIVCEQKEYGDYSTTMGTYLNGYTSQPYMSRYSATELDKLNVLPENKKVLAIESGEYKLAPVYSQIIDLPKVLYIPIGNQLSYSVEYRPAFGNETALAQTQLFIPGTNIFYTNTPSHGVQLRILKTEESSYSRLLPQLKNYPRFSTALVSDSLTGAQVHPIGKVFTLSDGSTVTFASADPTVGATVKVTRPKDSEAPVFGSFSTSWQPGTYFVGVNGERLVKRVSGGVLDYPSFDIKFDVGDDLLVKQVALEINGAIVDTVNSANGILKKKFTYQTNSVGKFDIRLIATDFFGNETKSEVKVVETSNYLITKANFTVSAGDIPSTSLRVLVAKSDEATRMEFTSISGGTITLLEENSKLSSYVVTGLPRNSKFTATLTTYDADGNSDGGQEISGTTENAVCTNTVCYVGVPWVVQTGNWQSGVGNLSLQELIKGKWVTIKTAKPTTAVGGSKKFPLTYAIKLTYSTVGKHSYRFSIAANKKFQSYTSKTFVQVVRP